MLEAVYQKPDRHNRFILPFNPQTWVRTTQSAKTIFRIPEAELHETSLRYKKRLIKYAEYKETLHGAAKAMRFDLGASCTAIYFFMPMPIRWNKKKRAAYHMQLHQRKPDLSNLLKAFEDALLPKKDEVIAHYSGLGKYWVDSPNGWIEIHTHLPMYKPTSDTI